MISMVVESDCFLSKNERDWYSLSGEDGAFPSKEVNNK
jgi:hypothetical protein